MHLPIKVSRLLLIASALGAGCTSATPITQTPFAREATDAASVFSAAAETISFVHADRLTVEYGKAAMVNFDEQVRGVASELPALQGAPGPASMSQLAQLVAAAAADLQAACLAEDCDWETQVQRLNGARAALLEAAGQ